MKTFSIPLARFGLATEPQKRAFMGLAALVIDKNIRFVEWRVEDRDNREMVVAHFTAHESHGPTVVVESMLSGMAYAVTQLVPADPKGGPVMRALRDCRDLLRNLRADHEGAWNEDEIAAVDEVLDRAKRELGERAPNAAPASDEIPAPPQITRQVAKINLEQFPP